MIELPTLSPSATAGEGSDLAAAPSSSGPRSGGAEAAAAAASGAAAAAPPTSSVATSDMILGDSLALYILVILFKKADVTLYHVKGIKG